eukprot:749489-Hanusia_phi.AAC.7
MSSSSSLESIILSSVGKLEMLLDDIYENNICTRSKNIESMHTGRFLHGHLEERWGAVGVGAPRCLEGRWEGGTYKNTARRRGKLEVGVLSYGVVFTDEGLWWVVELW